MSDEERRKRERAERAGGMAQPEAYRSTARVSQDVRLVAHLRDLIGKWIYADGTRLNWVGRVTSIMLDPLTGAEEAIYCSPLRRIGNWDADGPTESVTEFKSGWLDMVCIAALVEYPKAWKRPDPRGKAGPWEPGPDSMTEWLAQQAGQLVYVDGARFGWLCKLADNPGVIYPDGSLAGFDCEDIVWTADWTHSSRGDRIQDMGRGFLNRALCPMAGVPLDAWLR